MLLEQLRSAGALLSELFVRRVYIYIYIYIYIRCCWIYNVIVLLAIWLYFVSFSDLFSSHKILCRDV